MARAQQSALPQPIADFIASTRMSSPQQLAQMGMLANKIPPWEFADFCQSIALGVEYVHRHFGTCPRAICFTDDPVSNMRYRLSGQTIFIPRQAVKELLDLRYARQPKTEPYVLSSNQMATLYAVEEAYHHYQYVTNPKRTEALAAKQPHPPGDGFTKGYSDNPLETEAAQVVQNALKELGFDTYQYQMVPGARPYRWQEHVEQGRLPHSLAQSLR